jgi:uncharacterized protein YdhG (YjbR/CyaY superfamily)
MTDNKRITTIDDYIASFPAETQVVLERVRQIIRHSAPEATETISYGIPTFDLNGKHLVFFAGWKQHISLYPLARYKRARGSIQFPLNKPIPYDLVEQIVTLLMREKPENER